MHTGSSEFQVAISEIRLQPIRYVCNLQTRLQLITYVCTLSDRACKYPVCTVGSNSCVGHSNAHLPLAFLRASKSIGGRLDLSVYLCISVFVYKATDTHTHTHTHTQMLDPTLNLG